MRGVKHLVLYSRIVGWLIIIYGLLIITGALLRNIHFHGLHDIDFDMPGINVLIAVSYIYLGNLLLRQKRNAWLTATALSLGASVLYGAQLVHYVALDRNVRLQLYIRLVVSLGVLLLLSISRPVFRVRSDVRSFQQAVRVSAVLLAVTLLYGIGGFLLLDRHDIGRNIGIATAVHQTIDQFGLTTPRVVAHSKRARFFLDSLPALSIGALSYMALSFFQPLRSRLVSHAGDRQLAEKLLTEYPSDIDDFFKLWPHDKQFLFSDDSTAGVAFHVARGVAIVVGNPFGDPKHIPGLLRKFKELCYVNDWMPAFIHIDKRYKDWFERHGMDMQQIGEEAILPLSVYESHAPDKYFRQIRNRYAKLGFTAELVDPPHNDALISRLRTISDEWLSRPGRSERGLTLGYFSPEYMQQSRLLLVRDAAAQIQGFINVVPTYEPQTANYDLLRSANKAPGNCNDYLLMSLIEKLAAEGVTTLNLGLCPLAGLDKHAANATLIDNAMRFIYANGDRLYSFSGLYRFKAKYGPEWEPRYLAYPGGVRNFTRILSALSKAMKVNVPHAK